jgi:hypothetical protein
MPSQLKGTAIQIYLEWLRAELPAPQVEGILARLAPATRTVVLEELLPSVQYPYPLYAELLEATRAVVGADYERLAWRHGAYAADLLLAGVYKSTLKAGDVERTLQSLARGWQIYFDTGEIRIAEQRPGRYVFVISDESYHPLHPAISAGYVKRACEMAGAAQVNVEVHGVPPRIEMAITWRPPAP